MHWQKILDNERDTPLADALRAARYDGWTLIEDDDLEPGPEGRVNVATSHWVDLELRVIDHEAVAWFRHGNCAILAYEIHQITGWPLLTIHAPDGHFVHAAVRTPAGARFDITGPETGPGEWDTENLLLSHSPATTRDHATAEPFLAVVGDEFSVYPDAEREVVKDFARHLLTEHPVPDTPVPA